jgi:hypothetical protein
LQWRQCPSGHACLHWFFGYGNDVCEWEGKSVSHDESSLLHAWNMFDHSVCSTATIMISEGSATFNVSIGVWSVCASGLASRLEMAIKKQSERSIGSKDSGFADLQRVCFLAFILLALVSKSQLHSKPSMFWSVSMHVSPRHTEGADLVRRCKKMYITRCKM